MILNALPVLKFDIIIYSKGILQQRYFSKEKKNCYGKDDIV